MEPRKKVHSSSPFFHTCSVNAKTIALAFNMLSTDWMPSSLDLLLKQEICCIKLYTSQSVQLFIQYNTFMQWASTSQTSYISILALSVQKSSILLNNRPCPICWFLKKKQLLKSSFNIFYFLVCQNVVWEEYYIYILLFLWC